MNRRAVRSCEPEEPREAVGNGKLAVKFSQNGGLAVSLDKRRRQWNPVVRYTDQLEKDNFQIVAVALRLGDPEFVACVEVNQGRSFRIQVTDDVVEVQIAVGPCRFVMATLNLVDPP
jgi:hypothetical protein